MTLVDLYEKALQKMQIVAAGEPVAPEDQALIAAKYVAVWDMLSPMGLTAWAVDEDVPAYAELPLTAMLAFASANDFGLDAGRFAAEGAIGLPAMSLAERQLRQQLARKYVSIPATSEYF